MKIHILVTFAASAMFHETRTTAFNLNTAPSLLLNMLDVSTSMTNDLSTEIETWDWFKVYWNLLFRPFALSILVLASKRPDPINLLFQTHLAQLDLALACEIDAHRLGSEVPASSVRRSSGLPVRGHFCLCLLREDREAGSSVVSISKSKLKEYLRRQWPCSCQGNSFRE